MQKFLLLSLSALFMLFMLFLIKPSTVFACTYPDSDSSCASGVTICEGTDGPDGSCDYTGPCNCYEEPPSSCTSGTPDCTGNVYPVGGGQCVGLCSDPNNCVSNVQTSGLCEGSLNYNYCQFLVDGPCTVFDPSANPPICTRYRGWYPGDPNNPADLAGGWCAGSPWPEQCPCGTPDNLPRPECYGPQLSNVYKPNFLNACTVTIKHGQYDEDGSIGGYRDKFNNIANTRQVGTNSRDTKCSGDPVTPAPSPPDSYPYNKLYPFDDMFFTNDWRASSGRRLNLSTIINGFTWTGSYSSAVAELSSTSCTMKDPTNPADDGCSNTSLSQSIRIGEWTNNITRDYQLYYCGDGQCLCGENASTCSADCATINGACSTPATHYNCSAGTTGTTQEYANRWEWWCIGTGLIKGTDKWCQELKATPTPASTPTPALIPTPPASGRSWLKIVGGDVHINN